MGERFGLRFGEEGKGGGQAGPTPEEQALADLRNTEVECALRVVLAIANETDVPLDLRARAHYLAGNLEFLRKGYEEAVRHYDESLKLIPGIVDGGDTIGQDAAWNRAIALFRIEEEKKKEAGAPDGGSGEAGPGDASNDRNSSPDGQPENQDGGGHDPKPDGGQPPPKDAGGGGSDANQPNHDTEDAAPPPPPSVNQDQRMLDMLESAPTFQQQDAKNRASVRKFRGKDDK